MKPSGVPDYKIWLLGDSNPKYWQGKLDHHLDERHPARHNIWTPILLKIQDKLFREERLHLDESKIYVRNAVEDSDLRNKNKGNVWDTGMNDQLVSFKEEIDNHKPIFIFSFGSFAFEFARRTIVAPEQHHAFSHWGADKLGLEFDNAIKAFNLIKTNVIPLLHATIARGSFLQSHHYFCTGKRGADWESAGLNYFQYCADYIGEKLIKHKDELKIWV